MESSLASSLQVGDLVRITYSVESNDAWLPGDLCIVMHLFKDRFWTLRLYNTRSMIFRNQPLCRLEIVSETDTR
jgi:hypothetical protein